MRLISAFAVLAASQTAPPPSAFLAASSLDYYTTAAETPLITYEHLPEHQSNTLFERLKEEPEPKDAADRRLDAKVHDHHHPDQEEGEDQNDQEDGKEKNEKHHHHEGEAKNDQEDGKEKNKTCLSLLGASAIVLLIGKCMYSNPKMFSHRYEPVKNDDGETKSSEWVAEFVISARTYFIIIALELGGVICSFRELFQRGFDGHTFMLALIHLCALGVAGMLAAPGLLVKFLGDGKVPI